jgi:hypothetical protein
LKSLAEAGFDSPRLFVDGPGEVPSSTLEITRRSRPVGAFGNWALAAWELYILEPRAQRYAVFQDDLVACRSLREYLEQAEYPANSYLNLFTFFTNEKKVKDQPKGWVKSDQLGRGAVALVFDHQAMFSLLTSPIMSVKPQLRNGNQNIDGAIQQGLVVESKFTEYVHNPSLVQHVGKTTSIGKDSSGRLHPKYYIQDARTFPGEQFDALTLLEKRC